MDELFAPVLFPVKAERKPPKGVIQVRHKPAKIERYDDSPPKFVSDFKVITDNSRKEE